MYGDLANKLMVDTKRTASLNEIPMYSRELIKDIIQEVLDLNKDVNHLDEQQRAVIDEESDEERMIRQCQLFTTHLSMRRNKRCLLVYEKLRADKLVDFCWLNVDPITSGDASKSTSTRNESDKLSGNRFFSSENLSHAELDYYKQYQELVSEFKSAFADLDLTMKLEPPKEIFIDVRVLKNGGEIQTEYGAFNLIKDSQFFVRKSDVERLIQQGYLEEI